ncbi:hypothetical protein [Streptomyces reniochalinae]|nr:hypothetical protein [Streptomyces reniochalinae]
MTTTVNPVQMSTRRLGATAESGYCNACTPPHRKVVCPDGPAIPTHRH